LDLSDPDDDLNLLDLVNALELLDLRQTVLIYEIMYFVVIKPNT
jgi:hypothetical protein